MLNFRDRCGGNTNYRNPIVKISEILETNPMGYIPVVLFMTDGVCGEDGAAEALSTIMTKYSLLG